MRPATTEALASVDALLRSAFAAKRSLTADERRHVDDVLALAEVERADDALRDEIEHTRTSKSHTAGLGASLAAAGFDAKTRPRVELSAFEALRKAPAPLPTPTSSTPRSA
jgi:hypothetical protein